MNYLIIGQGAAGTAAALEIKKTEPESSVIMITEETDAYYSRIDLPSVVSGEKTPETSTLMPASGFEEAGITVLAGKKAASIDRIKKEVRTEDGQVYPYDKLLLATGCRPSEHALSVAQIPNAFTLWTLQDALALRSAALQSKTTVVVGSGFIGLKTASALKKLGLDVTLSAGRRKRLMPRQLDERGSDLLKEAVEKTGIKVLTLGGVDEYVMKDGLICATRYGEVRQEADLFVLCVGTEPQTALAKEAGLDVNQGILVNEYLQTSDEDIFAAGDCAEMINTRGEKSVSATWPSAVTTGGIAAWNMTGDTARPVPYLNMNSVEIAGVPIVSAGDIFAAEDGTTLRAEANGCYRVLTFDAEDRLTGFLQMGSIAGSGIYVNAVRERLQWEEIPSAIAERGADYMELRNVSSCRL